MFCMLFNLKGVINMNANTVNIANPDNALLSTTMFIRWGAIIAGVAIALSTEVLLNFLGMGIGLVSLNMSVNSLTSFSIGALIWLGLSGIISMFIAGWVTSYLANTWCKFTVILHSILVWSFATLITVTVSATAGGALIGGATSIMRSSINAVSQKAMQKLEDKNNKGDAGSYSGMSSNSGQDTISDARAEDSMTNLGAASTSIFISFFLSILAGIAGALWGRKKAVKSV